MATRILVIDDTKLITKIVYYQFSAAGYEVLVANDGPTGLKMASAQRPDLILLDVQMPGMDGYEVCRRLRRQKETANTPIIMLTSMSSLSNMQAGFEAGADDYITKPFEAAELKMRVSAMLRRAQRQVAPETAPTEQVIAVFSLRGGAGCSSLAVNLAVGLSQLWAAQTILLDLALPTGLCDIMLNLRPKYNLSDLTEHDVDIIDEEMILGYLSQHETGVRLLGGVVNPLRAELVTDNLVSYLLEHLRRLSPYVVIDTAHAFSPPVLAALDNADQILMPLTPDMNSVRLAVSTLEVFDALGYDREKTTVIVNHTFPQAGIAPEKIEKAISHPVRLATPHTPAAWSEAINVGWPVIAGYPKTPLVAMLV